MAGRAQHSAVRESDNYFWNENTDHLGRGSFGSVYKCYKKDGGGNIYDVDENSPVYAVKVRRGNATFREGETETWIKASGHDNIVKLLNIEKELHLNVDVIVMEYCNGGSLQDYLDLPEHSYGLPDSDLLAVLHDLTAGMRHLHELKISHRDIKPMNVMCSITQPGVATFKFGDFGDARSLISSSEVFHSTPGTGPYADPDLLRAGVQRTTGDFNSTVDLWSLAVTLYQCVTGRLPFICLSALGSRDDHNAALISMHASRPEGAISGILNAGESDPDWRSTYPADCLISRALKERLLPLQKRLFSKTVTFGSFFKEVSSLVQCRGLRALDVFSARLYHLYISSEFRIDDVRSAAQNAIGVDVTCDMLLHSDGSPLTDKNIDKVLTKTLTVSHRGRIMDSRVKPLFIIRNPAEARDADLGEDIHDLVEVTIMKAKINPISDRDAARLRAFRMKTAVEIARTNYDCLKRGMMLMAARNPARLSKATEACHGLLASMLDIVCTSALRVPRANELSGPARQDAGALGASGAAGTDSISEAITTAIKQGTECFGEISQDLSQLERSLLLQAPSRNDTFIQHCALVDDLTRHQADICYSFSQMTALLRAGGRGFAESYSRVEEMYEACRTCLKNLHISFQKWIKQSTDSAAQPSSDLPRRLHQVVADLDSLAKVGGPKIDQLLQSVAHSLLPKAAPVDFKKGGCERRKDLETFHASLGQLLRDAHKAMEDS